ncbi:hypothetical protein QPK87_13330 [Kamptonema cortianum]|nr:hypothetical protein [Kamptonema cortianum]
MFDWSDEKDAHLKQKRGIGFQDIVFHISKGDVVAQSEHPNQSKYPEQKILFVRVDDYICLVPYIEKNNIKFHGCPVERDLIL